MARSMPEYSSTDDSLRWWAAVEPHKAFVVFEGDTLSYAEADAWVDRAAALLLRLGVQRGERVGVVGGNSLEWVISSLAALRIGAVHAALSERAVGTELKAMTATTETRFVVVAGSHLERLHEAQRLGAPLRLLPMEEIAPLRRSNETVRINRPEIDSDEIAAICYSSGSTGTPKGVALSMRSLVSIMHEWALSDPALAYGTRILAVLPLSPMGGFINSILRACVVGGTAYLLRKYDEHKALKLLIEDRCKTLMATPLIFQRISALPAFQNADLSSLTYAIIGGAPVPLDEFDKWFARGAALRQVYGSTETGGHFSVMPAEGARTNPAGAGRGNIYRKIKILRPDGTQCNPNEDGEITVGGVGVMSGYWNNKEATEATLRNGWVHTGDLGRVDNDGILTVTGRIKEVIITGGYNVGPNEVEDALTRFDGIKEAAVLPVKDVVYGEAIGAIVYATADRSIHEIVIHCRQFLADYKVPRYILTLDTPLPRTEQGKFDKVQMRKVYGEALARSPRPGH
jgi:fatty-acyl-CoA synthase